MLNEIKKYLTFRTVLDKFVLFIQFYILFALINLIDFGVDKWWLYSNNPEFYKSFLVVFSIFLVDITFFSINFYFIKIKGINLLNVGLTGAFTFLVLHPLRNPMWIPAFSALIAILLRFFVRFRNNSKPFLNPAAFGMIVTYFITVLFVEFGLLENNLFISWWAADFGPELELGSFNISLHWVIFLPIFFYFIKKFRRHIYAVISLISIVFFEMIYFSFIKENSLETTITYISLSLSTWIFMSFLMLVDPKTSPIQPRHQIILGSIVGLILVSLKSFDRIPEEEIFTILIMNVLTVLISYKRRTIIT